jgi:hypothetical protein
MKLNIMTKLLLGFLSIAAAVVGLGVFNITQMASLNQDTV